MGIMSWLFGEATSADVIKTFRVGTDSYRIRFHHNRTYWEIWADSHPPNTRGGHVHQHHLYPNGQICVARGKEPKRLDMARAIAASWAAGWSHWIRTGEFGKNGGIKVNVPD